MALHAVQGPGSGSGGLGYGAAPLMGPGMGMVMGLGQDLRQGGPEPPQHFVQPEKRAAAQSAFEVRGGPGLLRKNTTGCLAVQSAYSRRYTVRI